MRHPLFLALVGSVAINIVLLAALFSPKHAPATTVAVDNSGSSPAVIVKTKYTVVPRKQSFNWSEVESPDYRLYIGHLREIGCPEQTIRDIVVADVNQLYEQKRLDEVPTLEQEWWRSEPDTNLFAAASEKEQTLEQERRALLDDLLGPNWKIEDTARAPLPLNGPVLGDLSPETKQAVRDIVLRGQKQLELATNNAGGAAAAKIDQQIRADLAKVLTPAQLEEFLLRYSVTAQDLRNRLRGLEVTPDQFRKIFDLRDPIVLQLATAPDLSDASRAALQKELDDTIKNTLGPDQYHALQLAQDPDYRDAAAMAATNDAPPAVVDKLYRVKLLTKQEEDRINQDPSLTPDQKAAQIQAAEQQAKTVSNELLGVAPPDQPAPPPLPTPPPPMAIHPYSPGETVDLIAAQYGVTASSIIAANPDLNLDALARGTPIKVPLKAPTAAPPP